MSDDVLEVSGNLLINLSGWEGVGKTLRDVTVGDVRRWLKAVDQYNISDDRVLEDCVLSLYVAGVETVAIECGEHNQGTHKDALLVIHECVDHVEV